METEVPAKPIEHQFRDWEGHVFGFGYGTGEPYTLGALKVFMDNLEKGRSYSHDKMSALLTPTVAWLMINALCKADILEYGTSPRHGWLTSDKGQPLHAFVTSHSLDELVEIVCDYDSDDYSPCYPDVCNCGPTGYVKGRVCQNIFWTRQP